jgi:DNA polymerase IIIc chi subunit
MESAPTLPDKVFATRSAASFVPHALAHIDNTRAKTPADTLCLIPTKFIAAAFV